MTNPQQAFAEGLEKLAAIHPALRMDLDWGTAIAILGNLQLALRHPDNRGDSAAAARAFCDSLISNIERVVPELGPLLRMGDDPQHDQPRSAT